MKQYNKVVLLLLAIPWYLHSAERTNNSPMTDAAQERLSLLAAKNPPAPVQGIAQAEQKENHIAIPIPQIPTESNCRTRTKCILATTLLLTSATVVVMTLSTAIMANT